MIKRCMALFLAIVLIAAGFPSMAAAAEAQPSKVQIELDGLDLVVDKSALSDMEPPMPAADDPNLEFKVLKPQADIVVDDIISLAQYIYLEYDYLNEETQASETWYYSLYAYEDEIDVGMLDDGVLVNFESDMLVFQAVKAGYTLIGLDVGGRQIVLPVEVKTPEDADGFIVELNINYETARLNAFQYEDGLYRTLNLMPVSAKSLGGEVHKLHIEDSAYIPLPVVDNIYMPSLPEAALPSLPEDASPAPPVPAVLAVSEAPALSAPSTAFVPFAGPAPGPGGGGGSYTPPFLTPQDMLYIVTADSGNALYIAGMEMNGQVAFSESGNKEIRVKAEPGLELGTAQTACYPFGFQADAHFQWFTDFVDNRIVINDVNAPDGGEYMISIPFRYNGVPYLYYDEVDTGSGAEIDLTAKIADMEAIKMSWSDVYEQEADFVLYAEHDDDDKDIPRITSGEVFYTMIPDAEKLFTTVLRSRGAEYRVTSLVDMDNDEGAKLEIGDQFKGLLQCDLPNDRAMPGSKVFMYMNYGYDGNGNYLGYFRSEQPLEGLAILTERTSGEVIEIPFELYSSEFELEMPEKEGVYEIKVLIARPEAPPSPAAPAAPTASPAAGSYSSAQSVKLATATEGADIYYTVDGSEPSAQSTKYSSAISVSKTTTIKAVAVKGGAASPVAEFKYTISAASNGGGGGGGWGGGGGSAPPPAAPATPAAISDAAASGAAISAPTVTAESGEAGGFADVAAGEWYYEAVSFVAEKGIAQGVSGTEFSPQGTVTRAQFITMLCRAYGIPEMEGD
ncbi:MAG: chitobiase/beta-hexosaminidase C-terminal domain-containing protein, partial [Clostridiales Family XIII bacterium]|nr:chitobiase/beta-hexosaminidase C-terminal domain-containing protein [Clostridiales Family XIII bacterium]